LRNNETQHLASVLICTRNRARFLASTISAAAGQVLANGTFEIVIVDNNSTDDTQRVVDACRATIRNVPVRSFVEFEVGLSAARNRALKEARGAILCFLDDDAIPESMWLESLTQAYRSDPKAMCVGGAVVPVFEVPLPPWFPPEMRCLFMPEQSGDALHIVTYPWYPYGANVSFRATVIDKIGEFNTTLGYKGNDLTPSEETEYILRIEKAGYHVLIEPRAIVNHVIPKNRLTREYLRRRQYAAGKGRALLEGLHRGNVEKSQARWRKIPRLFQTAVRRLGLRSIYWTNRILFRASTEPARMSRQCYLIDRIGYRDEQWSMLWNEIWS
jgi:glucosyl-dolichyl phosphate glucuronosyltransferase